MTCVFSSPLKLAAGNYWIGVITGATGNVAGFRYDSVAASRDYNANTYTSGPDQPLRRGQHRRRADLAVRDVHAGQRSPSAGQHRPADDHRDRPAGPDADRAPRVLDATNRRATPTSGCSATRSGTSCLPIPAPRARPTCPSPATSGTRCEVQETASNAGGPSTAGDLEPDGRRSQQAAPPTFGKTSVGASTDTLRWPNASASTATRCRPPAR